MAIDLAAKWNKKFSQYGEVVGVIAGGDSAFVRAKEGFEDSQDSGIAALNKHSLKPQDTVILISASGSANFNIGAGVAATKAGCKVYYFVNSTSVPDPTQDLFNTQGVEPLTIDIGPQAIAGSTRLQAATLAELCLGYMLTAIAPDCSLPLLDLKKVNGIIDANLKPIMQIGELAITTFSSPEANFHKTKDESKQGYVTLLGADDSLREVMIDTTETAPTFSTNPPRRTNEETSKKAEFRAYMVTDKPNPDAWQSLIGRNIDSDDLVDVQKILISTATAEGYGSYEQRPTGEGNLVIAVLKDVSNAATLLPFIKEAKSRNARTALIVVTDNLPEEDKVLSDLRAACDISLMLEGIEQDPLGLLQTVALKQILNLISNYAMVGMNKVYGNRMFDLRPSNNKLIVRSAGIIKGIYEERNPGQSIEDEILLHYVVRAYKYKQDIEAKTGAYIPSPVKLVLTMIEQKCEVQKAIEMLRQSNENIDF